MSINLSNHFKLSLTLLFIVALALFGGYEWLKHRLSGYTIPGLIPRAAVVLPKNDKELVTYNDKTHKLTIVTSEKTIVEYAKNPTIELRKNGDVLVSRHLLGFELDPFMGFGYASRPAVFIGANVFHFSRFDIHGEIGFDKSHIGMYAGVGYNFWSNTSLNVSINPIGVVAARPDIALFVSLKF